MGWGKGIEINQVKRGFGNVSMTGNPIYKVLEVPGNIYGAFEKNQGTTVESK